MVLSIAGLRVTALVALILMIRKTAFKAYFSNLYVLDGFMCLA